jgi:radical SAM protein with 4Fe4S-binding SPASM domain
MYDADYTKLKQSELQFADLKHIYENICRFENTHNIRVNNYYITGGDPLLKDGVYDLLDLLRIDGRKTYILGIPEHITKQNIIKLASLGVRAYQVSLDGMRETHDYIRGQGSFDRTLQAIQLLSNSDLGVSVMYTVHRKNANEMFDVLWLLHSLKCRVAFAFDFMIPEGNAVKNDLGLFTAEEVRDLLLRFLHETNELRTLKTNLVINTKPSLFNALFHEMPGIIGNNMFKKGCLAGWGGVSILPNGDMLACRRLPVVIGNLTRDSFEDLFLGHPVMRALRRSHNYHICGDCKHYTVCRGCPAMSYAVSQNMFAPFPYCYLFYKCDNDISDLPLNISYEEEFEFIRENYLNPMKGLDGKPNCFFIDKAVRYHVSQEKRGVRNERQS